MDALLSLLPGGSVTALIGAVAVVLFAIWRAFSAGKAVEGAKQDRQRIESMRQAKEIEDEVDNLGSNDLDSELRKWLRDK